MSLARQRARDALDALETARTAWRSGRRAPAAVRICWDLDNTLVASGELLMAGQGLAEAIVAAEPMPGTVALLEALRTELPDAGHVVLSARRRAMRPDTLTWLRRHGLPFPDADVLLVPTAQAKPKVWARLANGASLVIVDDLTHGHHAGEIRSYAELVTEAQRVAAAFLGAPELERLSADPASAPAVARDVARAVRPGDRPA